MGFSFRRSVSFGPFRLNLSKTGLGASVGVRGARVTMSPRGQTYVTVGANGFTYRKALSSGPKPSSHVPTGVPDSSISEQITSVDVEQLRASSKSELVEDLNKRAQMFNPASVLIVFAAIAALVGFVVLASPASSAPSALPDLTAHGNSRQANRIDEYAELIARYGEPSSLSVTPAGNTVLRKATWQQAHLVVSFVPAGCVDAYSFFQTHKDDAAAEHRTSRNRKKLRTAEPVSPACIQPEDNASTIVNYEDTTTHAGLDSVTAHENLAQIINKSKVEPPVSVEDVKARKALGAQGHEAAASVAYNKQAFELEQHRIRDVEASEAQAQKASVFWLAGACLLSIPTGIIHWRNREKRTTELTYDLSQPAEIQHEQLNGVMAHLMQSQAIWRLDSKSAITDWKRNAGASYNVKRERVAIRRALPPRVKSNLQPICIDLGKLRMFFLPDQVLIWQYGQFASVDYKDLKFDCSTTRFIDESVQASDSTQVGTTWRYIRVDGGPDRRFSNNQQLPIMLYGVVTGVASSGLNIVMHISNPSAAQSFTSTFRNHQALRDREIFGALPRQSAGQASQASFGISSSIAPHILRAMTTLGVKPEVTPEQLVTAYRRMAQMYHPDKTAGLGPELQKLAEQKMKEVNAAHEEVRRFLQHA